MTWPAPEPDCWLHPAVEVRADSLAGQGLFAREPLPAGTVVSRIGGRLVSGEELRWLLDAAHDYVDTITVADDVHLVLPAGQLNGKGNHSCDPNLWWGAPYTLVARRRIAAGTELTNDYATSTGDPAFTMPCRCGAAACRGVVTGRDWTRPDLQARYGPHWVPALLDRVRPTRDAVEAWFVGVLDGSRSRDDADRWAAKWDADDEAVRWALDLLHGIDLQVDRTGMFLHDDEQVRGWLAEFRARRAGDS
ncbi:SET domain-containing protein [Asanoa hainanensis]|uniref:SET domain-containing protein n=1 Tax=Asanoa hainanensis TaxID=560556 RepID=A0A239NZW2_9ACTN|nr:SET domain-containing protein-lysine N-methyltransferase [Asanoa hainanensis]SNT60300.1 SET domain-containing protein [Asanoa hainanensis]